MTVSLELDRAARARGIASEFVPTGQTGIAIAGWGIAVDAVVSDFLAGAAEQLVVEGRRRGGELLFVEGQGSLVHPAYSGVTLGLFHGSVPHAARPLPPRRHDGDRGLARATRSRRSRSSSSCTSARRSRDGAHGSWRSPSNTAGLDDDAAAAAIAEAEDATGLPACDPVRDGADTLLDAVLFASA